MIKAEKTPPEVIDMLERCITRCVVDRIEKDPDVADAYLRVSRNGNKFSVRAMYIEESLGTGGEHDVALLDLMTDRNNCEGMEYWEPNAAAIRSLAESFSQTISIELSLN